MSSLIYFIVANSTFGGDQLSTTTRLSGNDRLFPPSCCILMSPNNSLTAERPAKGKGTHVTTACLGCRKRKIKCDGTTPTCSNCILYGQDCVFQHGSDKRKIAPKERLHALTAYCQQLESLLTANGIPLPTPPPLHGQDIRRKSQATSTRHKDRFHPESIPSGERRPESKTGHWSGQSSAFCHGRSDQAPEREVYNGEASSSLEHIAYIDDDYLFSEPSPEQALDQQHNTNAGPDLLVDQLSGRIGSLQIAEDGQLRFYGATSNLHILHNGPLSLSRSKFRSPSEEGAALLCGGGVGHAVDEGLEDHLLKLYFSWEDPSIHVVEEAVFWRERQKCKREHQASSLYSEVLTNAM